jgi:hypothetical protein
MKSPTAALAMSVLLSLALGGCGSAVRTQGKVIQGEISFIGGVSESDERLKGPGIAGASIAARGTGAQSSATLATATSGSAGEFSLSIQDQRVLMNPVEYWTRKDGYVDARATLPPLASDQRLLVILKPSSSEPPPPRPEPARSPGRP